MSTQIIGVIALLLVIIGIFIIYKVKKGSKLKKTETFKTRLEKGENILKK